VHFGIAHQYGSDHPRKSHALTEAIDGMAQQLTGDRTHFHLKAHGR
jgi:hypothetical protein